MTKFAGIDWGSADHAACVIDDTGAIITQLPVEHSAQGLASLLKRLARIDDPANLPIAIERPTGLLVDTLAQAGHPIVPIHPNALKACRPRYSAAGGKSDPGDAYILADVLRTDGHRFRALRPASDEIRALRSLVRSRDDLVTQRIALANQLRALLDTYWPGATKLFSHIDVGVSLDFIERYNTPTKAKRIGVKRLQRFLVRSKYSGRTTATELLERLHSAPVGLAGPCEEETKGRIALDFVASIRVIVERIRRMTTTIEHTVQQLPAGQIVMSFPRAGKLNAAQILAELGDDPARFQTADQLASEAGVAPVTRASGKNRGVLFRFACNKRLRRAITTWADNSRHSSPWARAIYLKARTRGCRHPHAIRILARAWIRVLWKCWQSEKAYEPLLHGAAKPYYMAA
jgi:transposase